MHSLGMIFIYIIQSCLTPVLTEVYIAILLFWYVSIFVDILQIVWIKKKIRLHSS